MTRLERGIEMLGHASQLAKACRDCFHDEEIKALVERRFDEGRIESLYITSMGQGKKRRYMAHVTIEWSRCALVLFGVGMTVRNAVVSALKKHAGQQLLEFPEPDDIPF